MSRPAIIQALGGRSLGELLDPAFLQAFGLGQPAQYGMVCGDVEASMASLESLGTTPFVHANMEAPGLARLQRRFS
jgi:hypothetical protein